MSDAELVRLTLAGDARAFEALVRAWASRVLAVCHARVGRADVAEELAQESIVRGYRVLSTLGEPQKFGQWLCGIATRVCLDWLKAKERSTVSLSALADAGGEGVASADGRADQVSAAEEAEERSRLMREVEKLPEKHREALMLFYYQEQSYEELAELLGVSTATINARLTQARQMLRERLGAVEGSRVR